MMRALRSKWPLLGVIAVALVLAVAFLRPEQAAAHAILERSLPVQNQQLEKPPELVEAWFSEALERSLTSLEVLDTQGNPVHTGETIFSEDPVYAAIAVPPDLGPGIYTVTYQNVSTVDGHTWSGFFSFIILEPDGSVPAGEALIPGGLAGQVGFLPEHTDSALRWLGLLAAVALAGGLLFTLLIARPAAQFLDDERVRRVDDSATAVAAAIALPSAVVVILSTLGQLLLLAERLGGLGEAGDILFSTRSGELWLSRIGLSLALLLLFAPALGSEAFRRSRQASVTFGLGAIGGLGLLITYSLGSHGAAGGGAFWAVGADFVHFAATAAWLGALVQLPLAFWWTRRRLEGSERLLYLANVLDRFSWLAVISVALLIGTGAFNGFVQLPTLESLWETSYGRVLIAKLALILPLLGVAGINAVFLKPALVDSVDILHGEDPEERPRAKERARLKTRLERLERALPRTVLAEFLLGAAVLASVSVLAQSTTADGELRQAASRPSGDFVASAKADDLNVELTISPFGLSVNTYSVRLEPKPGAELGEVLSARLVAVFDDPNLPPSAGTTGTSQELAPTGEVGVYAVEAALLTQPGDWRVQARIRRRGVDDAVTDFIPVSEVGGFLARAGEPEGLYDLPFTFVGWDIVAGGAMLVLGLGAFLIWNGRPPSWRRSVSASVGLSSAFAMLAGVVLIFGVHTHEAQFTRNSPIPATEESLAIGKGVYEVNCLTCHGREGRGDGPGAANLAFPPADLNQHIPYHSDGTFFLWISEGLPTDSDQKSMPAFREQLTEEERWHVINFLREAFGSGTFEPVLPEEPSQASQGDDRP